MDRKISNLKVYCELCNDFQCKLLELHDHQTKDCLDFKVDCQWKMYGCKQKIKRKNVDLHNKMHEVNHLKLKIKFLENNNEKKIQQLLRKFEIEKTNINMKWKQKLLNVTKQFCANNNNKSNSNTYSSSVTPNTPGTYNKITNDVSSLYSLSLSESKSKTNIITTNNDGTITYIPNNTNNNNNSSIIKTEQIKRKTRKKVGHSLYSLSYHANSERINRSRNNKNNDGNKRQKSREYNNDRSRSRSRNKRNITNNDRTTFTFNDNDFSDDSD